MAHYITQQDADFFFEMEKFPVDDKEGTFASEFNNLITLVIIITVAIPNLITL